MNNLFDIHSHILPGVDDGSSCVEESTLLVDMEYEQGVRSLILTPHFRPEMFEVRPEEREEVFRAFKDVVKEKYPDMNLYLGCEVYLNEKTCQDVANPLNRMLGTNVVLVEFNYSVSFADILKMIRSVQAMEMQIIIAHIERYDCLRERMNNVQLLKSMGCFMQVNCDAVIGKNGFMTKRLVDKLFKENYVDFVASDAHDIKRRKVNVAKAYKRIEKKFGEAVAQSVFKDNAAKLFGA